MITAMKKYHYSQAPLPFVGQKRMFASEFRKVLKRFSDRTVFVDLFGGSGLLSHITKRDDPRYSSFYIFRQKKSTIMTLCVSPRTYLAFQTEGKICNELGKLYEETQSMAAAIELYEKEH